MRWRAARARRQASKAHQQASASLITPQSGNAACVAPGNMSVRAGAACSPAADLSLGRVMPPHVSNSCRCGGGFFGLVFAGRTNAARAHALVGLCVSRRISRRCHYLCPAPLEPVRAGGPVDNKSRFGAGVWSECLWAKLASQCLTSSSFALVSSRGQAFVKLCWARAAGQLCGVSFPAGGVPRCRMWRQ